MAIVELEGCTTFGCIQSPAALYLLNPTPFTAPTACDTLSALVISPTAIGLFWAPAAGQVNNYTALRRKQLESTWTLLFKSTAPINASSFAYLETRVFYTLSALYQYSLVARNAAGDCTSGP